MSNTYTCTGCHAEVAILDQPAHLLAGCGPVNRYGVRVPTVTIEVTEHVNVMVLVDRGYGYGPELSASYPLGYGTYPEAYARCRAESMAKAEARKAEILAPYVTRQAPAPARYGPGASPLDVPRFADER